MNREQLFQKIIMQVAQGNADEYEALAKQIEQKEEKTLIPEYQAKLDSLKDNPIEEKDIADIIEKANNQEISQFEIAAKVLAEDFAKADDMEQIALLIAKVTYKVLNYRDENDVVKKTKSFENYEPMKPIDRMKFEQLKLQEAKLKDIEKDDKIKEIDKFVSSATKIDIDSLSTWEKGLLSELLAQEAKGISSIFLGKK